MIDCPLCDYENIEGVDTCERCGQPLSDSHLTPPPTAVERALVRDRIESLQPATPIAVTPTTPVHEALQILVDKKIGCLLVVEQEELVGVFTERDVIAKLADEMDELRDCPVSQFMTADPQTLIKDAKVVFAVRQMAQGGYRHIPIMDANERPTGVISVRDILRYFTDRLREQAKS